MVSGGMYGYALGCVNAPRALAGALAPVREFDGDDLANCNTQACWSRWCTLGDDAVCGAGNVCMPWLLPGEGSQDLEDLGACARTDTGPCAGKTAARECLTWHPAT